MDNTTIFKRVCDESIDRLSNALATQFHGWLPDYLGSNEEEVPPAPVQIACESLKSLIHNEIESGDLTSKYAMSKRVVQLLTSDPCMSWAAFDQQSKSKWLPLLQSYKLFKTTHPDSEPYLIDNTEGTACNHNIQKWLFQFFDEHDQPF